MTYSCSKCGSTSTTAAKCCSKPMASYSAVNQAALSAFRTREDAKKDDRAAVARRRNR